MIRYCANYFRGPSGNCRTKPEKSCSDPGSFDMGGQAMCVASEGFEPRNPQVRPDTLLHSCGPVLSCIAHARREIFVNTIRILLVGDGNGIDMVPSEKRSKKKGAPFENRRRR